MLIGLGLLLTFALIGTRQIRVIYTLKSQGFPEVDVETSAIEVLHWTRTGERRVKLPCDIYLEAQERSRRKQRKEETKKYESYRDQKGDVGNHWRVLSRGDAQL